MDLAPRVSYTVFTARPSGWLRQYLAMNLDKIPWLPISLQSFSCTPVGFGPGFPGRGLSTSERHATNSFPFWGGKLRTRNT